MAEQIRVKKSKIDKKAKPAVEIDRRSPSGKEHKN